MMEQYEFGEMELRSYLKKLSADERAVGTRAKYARDLRLLHRWLAGRALT